MTVYLAYLEHDCGCQDKTVVGVFYNRDDAENFAYTQLELKENSYFKLCGVEEFIVK